MMSRITTVVACFIFLVGALILPSIVLAGSATVTWQANTETDFAKYRVYWSTTAGTYGSYKAEAPKGTTTYVANGLTEGQTYYFVLTAVDDSGNESGFSSPPASKTIPGGTTGVPPAPALSAPASGANVAGTSVTFSWQAAQGATDYNLKVTNSSGAATFDQWLGNVLTYAVTGFANQGQSYSWTVTARNASGQGPAAAQRTFVNGASSTPPPSGGFLTSPANGASVSGTSITFKWQSVPKATYYRIRIYRSTGAVFYDRYVGRNLSYTVSGFANKGESFSWEVYPYGSAGLQVSPRWTFVNGTGTPSVVPPAPALSAPASGANVAGTSVTFSWQAAQGATDYNLKVTNSSGAVTFDQWLGNVLTYAVTGFANQGQSYSWTVTARNASGQGPAAAQRTFVNGASSTPPPSDGFLTSPANGASVSGTSITFKWQSVPKATYYRIRIYRSTGAVFYDRYVSSNLTHTVSGFANKGESFSWEVYPYGSAGLQVSPRWTFVNK